MITTETVNKVQRKPIMKNIPDSELSLRLRKVLAPLMFVPKDNNLRLELCGIMYLNFYFFCIFWGRQKRGSCSYVPSIEEEIRPT